MCLEYSYLYRHPAYVVVLYVETLGMESKKSDLLQGTLDLLVLKTLAAGPLHGYAIAQRILVTSRETLDVQQGSLYPALHRLERKKLVESEWRESENGRMAVLLSHQIRAAAIDGRVRPVASLFSSDRMGAGGISA